jgi:hypothetical protein
MELVSDQNVQATAFRRWGVNPRRTGSEWHSACPFCGEGHDRFTIFKNGGFFCRVCGSKGWLNNDQTNWKPDPITIQQAKECTEQLERERQDRIATWQRGYRDGQVRSWHDAMSPEHREYWRSQGIPDWAIDDYQLGFCSAKKIMTEHGEITLPVYTIPVYQPTTHAIVNVQYRLLNPPPGIGKYRQEYGLPSASFYAAEKVDGEAIIVEGAKKAIVVFDTLERKVQVVGLPSNCPSVRLLRELESYRRLYLILDPHSHKQVERIARLLHSRVGVVTMPAKPDDAIVRHGLDKDGLHAYLKMARWA